MSGEDTNVRCNDTIVSGGHLCEWKTLISKLYILYHINIKLLVLFDLILYVQSQQFFSYVRTGLPGLNQY